MVTNQPSKEAITLTRLRTSVEDLQAHFIQLEALAHAATQTLEDLPFVPRVGGPGWTEEQRFSYGRLHTLVFATADAAKKMLRRIDRIIDALNAENGNDSSEGGGQDEGGSPSAGGRGGGNDGESGKSGGNGEPDRGGSGSHGGSLLS